MLVEFLEKVNLECQENGMAELTRGEAREYIEDDYLTASLAGADGKILCNLTDKARDIILRAREKIDFFEYPVIDGAELKPKKRIHKKQKPTMPFHKLKIGQSFFVPCFGSNEENVVRSSVYSAQRELDKTFSSLKVYRFETMGGFIVPCDGILVMRTPKEVKVDGSTTDTL